MDCIIPANDIGSTEDPIIRDLIWLGSDKLTKTSSWQYAASAAPIHDATTMKARLLPSARAPCWTEGCNNGVEELEAAEGISGQKAAADCCWLSGGVLTAFGVEAPLWIVLEDLLETDPDGDGAAAAVRPLLHNTTTNDVAMRTTQLMPYSYSQLVPPRPVRVQTAAVGPAVAMKSIRVAAAARAARAPAPAAAAPARWMDGVEVQQWREAPADADDVIAAVTQCRTKQYCMGMRDAEDGHTSSSAGTAADCYYYSFCSGCCGCRRCCGCAWMTSPQTCPGGLGWFSAPPSPLSAGPMLYRLRPVDCMWGPSQQAATAALTMQTCTCCDASISTLSHERLRTQPQDILAAADHRS
ncbi:hypothetical protein VaNZ11_002931 [Volvox africanus]|uniref:Uncharacterized protein n=1 Tax=Volvox africanus TaxID=51714 RepID=A0ABQ5RTR7_9CHLO|nr:hypothetical protein VaNZ11_002931 [Volvox africanus]